MTRSALPSAGAPASSVTVPATVRGSANGDGEAGSTVTVVVVRSAEPSAYRDAMSVLLRADS